jgi:hypothetical protein
MTKTKALEMAKLLYGGTYRLRKLLEKALCDNCPTCDGTVKIAIGRIDNMLNKVAKTAKKRRHAKCETCSKRHIGPCEDAIRSDCDKTPNPYEGGR